MPRRTGLDTLYDNLDTPSRAELEATAVDMDFANDLEDALQFEEGNPGEFGSDPDNPREGMDEDEYAAAISSGIEAAENYVDTDLSPDRELAAKYYRAEPFGNEIVGRSAVVMSEVRDTVLGVMPALLRIFNGTTNAVEFTNTVGAPGALAEHQTAYINHIINKDNDGFMLNYSAFKDSLVRKTGIYTWWHEEKETVTQEFHTGLTETAFALLQMEAEESSSEDEHISFDIEVTAERVDTTAPEESPNFLGEEFAEPTGDPMQDGATLPPPQNFIRDVTVRRRTIVKRHRVAAVPPEEFILTPIASADLDEFPLVGRRQQKTIGELVAMGFDEDEIREHVGGAGGSQADALATNPERISRDPAVVEKLFDNGFAQADPSSEYVKFVTVYVLIDRDGDGIPERRKICTVGDTNKIIYDEITNDMVPFSTLCPDPEPHSPFGYSIADQTMDMQEIKSEMVRGVLDSLAESIFGRTAIIEGKVNIDDALSNERDQLVRVKEAGAIWSLSNPFNGASALPVLDYLDNVKARRTGITMAPSGLKADTLQSTSTDAVNAVVDAAQERTEMIARIFAETGIKRLYRGLLQQVVKHQDPKRMIQLRGKQVEIDPRSFRVDLDLDTNVGLGRGTAAKRIQALMMILGQQKEVYTTYGATNPVVTLHHISNTVEDLIRESGFNDVSRYMSVVSKDEADQLRAQTQATPEKPTPEELLYKAQAEKTKADLAKTMAQEETKRNVAAAKDDIERDKLDQEFYISAAELLGKFGIQANEQEMRARMEADRSAETLAGQAHDHAQSVIPKPAQGT